MSEAFSYCPVCQLPLKAISIVPDVHVSMCVSRVDDNEFKECPEGVHCLSTDIFHYRDFSHKLLAEYRSSSDFIPPKIEIKPSPKKRKTPSKAPKRSSPRKKKTPEKSNVINDDANENESDSEVWILAKKPRRNLAFSERPNKSSQSKKIVSNSIRSRKRGLSHTLSMSSTISPLNDKVQIAKENCDINISDVAKGSNNSDTPLQKSTIINVSLSSCNEFSFTKSQTVASMSSLSVSASGTSNLNSHLDSENSNKSADPCTSKVELRETVLTLNNLKAHNEQLKFRSKTLCDKGEAPEANLNLKEAVLTLERLKTYEIPSQFNMTPSTKELTVSESSANKGDMNGSFHKSEFDDIMPLSIFDEKLDSPASTVLSCSEFSGCGSPASTVNKDETERDLVNTKLIDPPSSPNVIIPLRRGPAILSSSSDSDVPLSKLISKKSDSPNKYKTNNKTTLKGVVKGGKVLRVPNKSPQNKNNKLNNTEPEINSVSEMESDSGKSSLCTDDSFTPSEKTSSSLHSDSVLSAQSTDQLSASSTSFTSSSCSSNSDSRSSDPSYSEVSDKTSTSGSRRVNYSPNHTKNAFKSPKKKHTVKSLSSVTEESSSASTSEISIREKLLFRNKKLSPKKSHTKHIKSPVKSKKTFSDRTLGLLDTTDSDDKSEWQSLLSKMRSGCYPSDLKIDSEDSLTVVSSCSGSDTSHASAMLPLRQCPFYKRIPDTPFAVDAFQYWNIPGVKIYFLSHFHSDHYIGLKKSFSHPIYCTMITANLVRMKLRVEEKWLRVLELNQPEIICGVEVTALDANHCPGSVMFLFCLTNGQSHLHVGDFRASKAMTFYPALRSISISKLFLDTTYCSPQYCFPSQEEVIGRVVDIVRNHVDTHPKTLVVCGSYTIGKEKVFLGIAEAMNWKIWARPEKQRVFACLKDPRINSRLVTDCPSARVHVLPMANLQIKRLQQHLESCLGAFTHIIAVKPTGWELNVKSDQFKVTSRDNITIYGVPYSEHSSFTELRDFVQFVQPREVVPTVNVGSAASRSKMNQHFSDWLRPSTQTDGKSEKQTKVSQYFKTSS